VLLILPSSLLFSHVYIYYKIAIPENAFDFSVIVEASNGDPDQFIYSTPMMTVANWTDTGTSSRSCIFVKFPPAGTFYYKQRMYNGPYTFELGFFLNYGSSCTLPSTHIPYNKFIQMEQQEGQNKVIKPKKELSSVSIIQE